MTPSVRFPLTAGGTLELVFPLRLACMAFRAGVYFSIMRITAVALLSLGAFVCWAQVEKSAEEWLTKCFQAYSQLTRLQSKTTLSVYLYTPRTPAGELFQQFRYTYTCQPPAQLNLTVENPLEQSEKRTLIADGNTLKVGDQSIPIGNSGMALIEQLVSADVVPPYDLVFMLGGRASQEKFRKQIRSLKVSKEDETQVVLTGKLLSESKREDDLEIVLDKSTGLMRSFRVTARYKLEGTDSAMSLVMEFQPNTGSKSEESPPAQP